MNWHSFQENWSELRGRVMATWSGGVDDGAGEERNRLGAVLHERYGFSREEANRKMSDWIKDPGVLDDWNDTRSILDM